jgi:hypothetical protein
MHAPIGVASMQLGLHAYIQKPLAHDLHEVRRLTEIARERKLQTQMGIQVHSSGQYKTAVNLIHSGVIGKIKEVHTWSNKKWGDSDPEPTHSDPIPAELNWDLWLGVAAERPFVNGVYHPGNWRKRLCKCPHPRPKPARSQQPHKPSASGKAFSCVLSWV